MFPVSQSQPADVVVWNNRYTIHAATGFDDEHDTRGMWRLTLPDGAPAEAVNL